MTELNCEASSYSSLNNGREKNLFYSFTNPYLILDYGNELIDPDNRQFGYTQGCMWSPDGTCFLVGSENKKLRVFNLPANVADGNFYDEEWLMGGKDKDTKAAVTVKESDNIYSYQWYPLMQSTSPNSCCFGVVARRLPVHLFDAWSGQLICSYSYYNHLDELEPAYSLNFCPNGLKLVAGYAKKIQVFDVERPGRQCTPITLQGHSGIISSLTFHPQLKHIFAAGSYSKSIGIYSLDSQKTFALFIGHEKGVTHLQFSSDGTKLFSGTRTDQDIICWDIRNPGNILGVFNRNPTTTQRIYFDISPGKDQYLVSGSTCGEVLIWDLEKTLPSDPTSSVLPSFSFRAHNDCVNGVSFHPASPLLITSCGQRVIPSIQNQHDSSSEDEEVEERIIEKSAKMWWIGKSLF